MNLPRENRKTKQSLDLLRKERNNSSTVGYKIDMDMMKYIQDHETSNERLQLDSVGRNSEIKEID